MGIYYKRSKSNRKRRFDGQQHSWIASLRLLINQVTLSVFDGKFSRPHDSHLVHLAGKEGWGPFWELEYNLKKTLPFTLLTNRAHGKGEPPRKLRMNKEDRTV